MFVKFSVAYLHVATAGGIACMEVYLIHSQSTRIWGLEGGGGAHWGVGPMNYNAHLCKKAV